MDIRMPQIKFKEYTMLHFLGNHGDYSPDKNNNRFPFLGYRAYSEEALPIIAKFSPEEFKFIYRVDINKRGWLRSCYELKEDGHYHLKEATKANPEHLKEIWNLFRETPYISSYYRCLPYLLPDDSKAKVINNKYIYMFRRIKGSGFTSIYREFLVKEGKFYQSKIETDDITPVIEPAPNQNPDGPKQYIIRGRNLNRNDDSEPKLVIDTVKQNGVERYRYYMKEDRTFSTVPTKSIAPPTHKGNQEYEYIFISSQVKLSLTKIYTLRKEIEGFACKRGVNISFFDKEGSYEASRRNALDYVEKEAERVKKALNTDIMEYKKKFPHLSFHIDMMDFIKKNLPLIPHNYEDILYNGPYNQDDNSNHTVYLIDYQSYILKLKQDFDMKTRERKVFLNKEINGYPVSDIKIITELVAQTVKKNKNDTDDAKDFKSALKKRLKPLVGSYAYKIWKNIYDNTLKRFNKQLELSGALLASAVDTAVFNDLIYDCYFLLTKKTVSDEDRELVEDMSDFSGEITHTLQQSKAGRMLLEKKVKTANKNFLKLSEFEPQEVNVTILYNNFKHTGDWLTLVLSTYIKKLTIGTAGVINSYLSTISLETTIEEINKIVAFQKIKVDKITVPNKKGGGKTKHKLQLAQDKLKSFGIKKYKEGGGYKRNIKQEGNTLKVEITELVIVEHNGKKVKHNVITKASEAFNILSLGFELWNLRNAYNELAKVDDNNLASLESIGLLGAITDTTTTILEVTNKLRKVTPYLNILSSILDWHVSTGNMKKSLKHDNTEAAMYHQISASLSASLALCGLMTIAVSAYTGAAYGSILGIKGAVFGLIVGLLIGISNCLATTMTDNDYELWFKYCFWGQNFGKGEVIPHFSNVRFKDWANKEKGIRHQVKAYYQLFATPTMQLAVKEDHNKGNTKLGVDIFPRCLNENSLLSISTKILSSHKMESGYNLTTGFIDLYTEFSSKPANCCVEMVKLGNNSSMVEKVKVRWTDQNKYKVDSKNKWQLYCHDLTDQIDSYDDQDGKSDPYLKVELKLDLYGDQQTVIRSTKKFNVSWRSQKEIAKIINAAKEGE